MEGSNTSSEMQVVIEEESPEGEVKYIWDEKLRSSKMYNIAKAFWRSPAGLKAIKNNK
jgi:hypothetical protein